MTAVLLSLRAVASAFHTARRPRSSHLLQTFATKSNFEPSSPPPSFLGKAVFDDILLTNKSMHRRNQDPNAVFVVTGASRGIGLQFVKSLEKRTQGTIVACCRNPNDMMSTTDRVHVLPLDLMEQESIEQLGESLHEKYSRVDALYNVAGILGDATSTPGPERSLARIDRKWMEISLAVHVVGPLMLTKALVPLLKRAPESVVANLSARVGSISDNQIGGWYSYRLSKAALNQATRTMAHEMKRYNVWTLALHPGTTDTDLSKPFQGNVQEGKLFPVEFTADRLLDIVDAMEKKHSGGFYDWSGKALSF